STLAAALSRSKNLKLVADDASPILLEDDKALVEPGDAEVWLWSESLRALGFPADDGKKAPIISTRATEVPLPIAAIAVLSFGNHIEPRLHRLHGHDALAPLLAATVRLVVDEREVQLREIANLDQLVTRVPIYQLSRKKTFTELPRCVDLIGDLLRGAVS
ncbi:MAG: hypothetical protein ACREJX_20695, partial [Polyangiaceae bacterium]